MQKVNRLKNAFKEGKTVIGTWASTSSANIVNVLGTTGLDFAIIDMEHGSMSFETTENMVRAAEASGMAPIVRVWDDHEQTILRALETGPRSVMIPHINSKEKAERVAKCCRYFPDGNRGLSPYTRIHSFTHENIAESLESENEVTIVGILVEGKVGLENLSEIVKVKGIDLIYLGLFDICQSVGLPGQVSHPKVLEEVKRCNDLIQSHGIASGSMSTSVEYIKMLQDMGYNFIAYLNDAAAMRQHFIDTLKQVR